MSVSLPFYFTFFAGKTSRGSRDLCRHQCSRSSDFEASWYVQPALVNLKFLTSPSDDAVGDFLYEQIARFLDNLGVPRGLKAVGYKNSDIDMLVQGTIPQRRVLDLAPGIGDVTGSDGAEHLTRIIESSMSY
ncbi:hydroxyacid-oxoacid transhydrogenase [Rhizoctonia solani AG-1 IB]|uniref:Hydroxyacid-oxoacid transhydrogenase n=1 Tax=Thanatephorus cucumeris (strain AG1-IB / isolate 7/3/14) TaxID=1108050 RepID=M5BX66_THACB|nr:hydroxyacid-oxoacid transhydrogenase [Rhizoctonia solani AG-1 IB]